MYDNVMSGLNNFKLVDNLLHMPHPTVSDVNHVCCNFLIAGFHCHATKK